MGKKKKKKYLVIKSRLLIVLMTVLFSTKIRPRRPSPYLWSAVALMMKDDAETQPSIANWQYSPCGKSSTAACFSQNWMTIIAQ
ncbi:hypothetical protein BDW62DRAFT_176629 [Aspergillus aurantiobrunneus]